MFCDEIEIKLKAGNGGNGLVSFRREIFTPRGGPDGGDGGDGGSIYLQADSQLSTLAHLRHTKLIKAPDGQNGGKKKMKGKKGKDLIIKVPLGTLVYDKKTNSLLADLNTSNQKILVASGGKGGFGNAHFTSSTRQKPRFAEKGEPGEEKEIRLELKLIADVGIIGLPNVGKSTLLSRISSARPKIASYPFTTLVPNLGIVEIDNFSFVACDIPGLIEGAYQGKGLGDKFLRHIERCRVLIHLLDATSSDLAKDYRIIMKELKKFSEKLTKKPQIIAINKIDAIDRLKVKSLKLKIKKEINKEEIFFISAVTGEGIKDLLYRVKDKLVKLPKPQREPEPIKIFRPYEKLIKIEKKDNVFILYHRDLERLVLKTDFSNEEAISRLFRIFQRKGVWSQLHQKGAKVGDKIKIAGKTITITNL